MINEVKVECFLSVAKTLSFTKASKQLYISQQAVSKHIANLEKDIGHKLIDRTHHNVELTYAGEKFFLFFSNAASKYSLLQSELTDGQNNEADLASDIRIGYQNWMNFGGAPGEALATLKKEFSDIHLIGERHSPSELLRRLEYGNLDIILIHKRFLGGNPSIDSAPLFETQMIVAASEENPLATSDASYKTFSKEPLLIDALDGESNDHAIRRAQFECKRFGFVPRNIIVVPNRDSIYTEAESNRGVFFGSSKGQTPPSLKIIKYPTDILETICCAWKKDAQNSFIKKYIRILQKTYLESDDQFRLFLMIFPTHILF